MGAAIIAKIGVFPVFILSCFNLPFNKYVGFFQSQISMTAAFGKGSFL